MHAVAPVDYDSEELLYAYRHYGFCNYSTFYRNYLKIYGCCPSESSKQPPQDIYL